MPPRRIHRFINVLALLPTIYVLGSHRINFVTSMLFGLAFLFCTFVVTPDRDMQVGMKHRGISHSFLAWCTLFVAGYYYIGMFALGCVVPIFSHIFVDRTWTKIKRAF